MSVEELLPGYLLGELSDEEREQVRAALQDSPQLRDELARYQQLVLLFAAAAVQELEAPADMSTRIMRQITVQFYLGLVTNWVGDLVGVYGRALAFYLGLR